MSQNKSADNETCVIEKYAGFYSKFMTKNLILLQNIILPPDLPSSQPESGVYCYTIINKNCIQMLFSWLVRNELRNDYKSLCGLLNAFFYDSSNNYIEPSLQSLHFSR